MTLATQRECPCGSPETALSDLQARDRRYTATALGVALLWIGGVALVPGEHSGAGWLGLGVVFLGLNWVRQRRQMRIRRFSLALGTLASLVGLAKLVLSRLDLHVQLPLFPLASITIGTVLLLGAIGRRTGN